MGGSRVITTYHLRAASTAALHAALVDASEGKARPYAWEEDGILRFDEARVRLPCPEYTGAVDPDGEAVLTGMWLCDVALVDVEDEALAALAI